MPCARVPAEEAAPTPTSSTSNKPPLPSPNERLLVEMTVKKSFMTCQVLDARGNGAAESEASPIGMILAVGGRLKFGAEIMQAWEF